MNQLSATIMQIDSDEHLSLVVLETLDTSFSALVIGTPATHPHLQVGKQVQMLFKETEMSLAKQVNGALLSLRNRFEAQVVQVHQGKVLTSVELNWKGISLSSIITSRSAQALHVQPGDIVEGLVKSNEITLLYESA